jgi:Beta galactosidase small chain
VTGRLAPTPGKKQNAPVFITHLPLRPWRGDYSLPAAGDLSFTDSNNIFTIISAKTQVQFDKQTGWLLQYKAGGSVLMGDTAGLRSDLGLPDTLQPHLQLFFASTGTQIVIVKAEYTLPEINCLLHLSYTFNAAGDMLVEQVLEADTASPSATGPTLPRSELTLSRFGMTWLLPQNLDSVSWYGDSEQAIATITAPVSLSREAAFHGIRWLTLRDREGKGPRISADSNLLQLKVLPANSLPAQLHPQQLGIYSTMYPATQRRFNFSFKVIPQPAASHPPTNHPDQKK